MNPQLSDVIERPEANPLLIELTQAGVAFGNSYILDYSNPLYLTSGDNSAPDLYPLWFKTEGSRIYEYDALWSVPLFFSGNVLWRTSSSQRSYTSDSLNNISPVSISRLPSEISSVYDTALAITLEKGNLVLISGSESLSDLMVLSNTGGYNGAWIQSLAFFLSNNKSLTELRKKSMGYN